MGSSYIAIQGPPGSGKTYTGSRVVRRLVEKYGWRVGVVAQSHTVVENMLDAIVDAGLDPALVGKSKPQGGTPAWTKLKDQVGHRAAFLTSHLGSGCVIGGTVWTFAAPDLVEGHGLDLLVVDEAGQFALAPTIAASVAAQRLLLLGDPQQLPQVSQGTHAEPVNESALGWLMEDRDTLPAALGYFLDRSHRMHPDLCATVSVLSYDGRLRAAPADRELVGVVPGLEVLTVSHTDNSTESPEEAAAVVAAVEGLIGARWRVGATQRMLGPSDFLVVAPYNAQVELVREALKSAGISGVRVGTVDKFQGQEAPVAVVSMTASSPGDVPRGMGFLLSRNRVNVAISRAQWKAILVRSPALTSYMPATTRGVLELGAFIGLCDTGAPVAGGDDHA
jgi:superfamily I DNA and/or RNA helicase